MHLPQYSMSGTCAVTDRLIHPRSTVEHADAEHGMGSSYAFVLNVMYNP